MATDRSRTTLQAILVQDSAWGPSCLAADSSYTGLDPLPGIPQPASTGYGMTLLSGGSFADIAATLTITTQQGGLVGREGASFIWDSGGDPYGWDAPTVITGWESVVWATSPKVGRPCIVGLSTSLYAVWASGSLLDSAYACTIGGSPVALPALAGATLAVGCSPCLVVLPDRLVLYLWVQDAVAQTLALQMQFSLDDGATWSLGSTNVLPEILSSDATGYTVIRTRAAYSNGQILLIVGLQLNNTALYPAAPDPNKAYRNEVRQFASSDGGNTFSQVWASHPYRVGTSHWWEDPNSQDGGGFPDVVAVDGTFYIAWISLVDLSPYAFRLESAYQSLDTTTGVQASTSESWGTLDATSAYFTDGDCVLTADETGVLYISGRTPTAGNRWVINHSTDRGDSWPAMAKSSQVGGGGLWWDAETTATHPTDAAACWYDGSLVILAAHDGTSTYDGGSLSVYYLGGSSSVTMPGYDRFRADSRQVSWGQTWLPLDKPGDSGWTRTVTGSPTESLSSGLLATSVTLAQSLIYSVVPGGTVAGGVIATWSADHTSGTSYRVRLRTADATEGYQLTITLSSTTLTIIDGASSTTITTATVAGEVAILASITAGVASVWYRVVTSQDGPRAWTRLVDSVALTDDAGGTWTANLIDWGHPLGGAAGASWRWFHWIDDEGASYAGTGLGSVVLPDELLGRRYAASPVAIDGSTTITAQNGPTYAGDSWSISVRYENGPENIFPVSAPSPRMALHLDETVTNDLIFDLHTGSEATALLGLPVAMAILGTNAHTATLTGWDGAAWVTVLQWSAAATTGASYTRAGRMLVVTSGGSLRYVTRNECAGWSVDLGGGDLRRVAGNTEGLIGGSNPFSAILQMEGITGAEASSGTCALYASDVVAVAAQPSFYQRFRLRFTATTTPEGYLKVGKVVLGSLAALSRRPSNGRSLEIIPQAQTSRPVGGPRAWRKLGPSVQRYALELSDLLPTSQIFAASPSPDYVRLQSNGTGMAAWHGAALSMAGLIEENQGRYVVYLGSVPQVDNATSTQNLQVGGQILYGRLVEPGTLTIARGNEASSEVHTLSGIVLETEP